MSHANASDSGIAGRTEATTAERRPRGRRSGATPRVGDQVVVIAPRPIAPGSIMSVRPGDTGTVVEAGHGHCAVRVHGLAVTVPVECVQSLGRPERGTASGGA